MSGTHRVITAPALAPPTGFAHAVVAAKGTTVYLGGQTAQGPHGRILGESMVEQFDVAAGNVLIALTASGGRAEHLVSLLIFVTDVGEYRRSLGELAPVYRKHFGRHYPAIALLGVSELFDEAARIELVATAVIPQAT
ncbi:MAG: RidA family protein [Haloechinothrix sp.]